MTLRDQGFRYCLSPDRTHSRWLSPAEMKVTHSDWMDVTDTPTDELVALICWQDKPLPHGEAECLAVQESLPL
jgi:hypothetical protein